MIVLLRILRNNEMAGIESELEIYIEEKAELETENENTNTTVETEIDNENVNEEAEEENRSVDIAAEIEVRNNPIDMTEESEIGNENEDTMTEFEIGPEHIEIKIYRYRWFIVALFGLYTGANLYQINQFTIIDNIAKKYYNVDSFAVNTSQGVFMGILVFFMVPSVWFTEKYNIRHAALLCSLFTFLGSIVKLFGTHPDADSFRFIILGQGLCACGQVLMIMLAAKVVAIWCGKDEQNRACSFALWGGEIGMLIGAVTPILFVNGKDTNEEIQEGILTLLISNVVFCGVVLVLVYLFFKEKPPTPPSIQQAAVTNKDTEFRKAICELFTNRAFLLLISVFGTSCGIWSAFGIVENQIYLHYFPDSLSDLAFITAITTITGGIIGNAAFGTILDKTLKYKLIAFISLFCTTISYLALAICLEMGLHIPSCITLIIFGFFASSSVCVSFQYIAEVTYPVSEVISISLLQISIAIATIIFTYTFSSLVTDKYLITTHVLTVFTFSCLTVGTQFLSSELKRMLVTEDAPPVVQE